MNTTTNDLDHLADLWSISDFLIGTLLLCQAAVVIGGGNYPLNWMPYIGLVSLIVIVIGRSEHRDYLRLCAELEGRSAN